MKKLIKLTEAIGIVLTALMLMGFTDVPDNHWANQAITQLSSEGSIAGFNDGSFRPNDPVTRAQLVKMLGSRTESSRSDSISDLDSSHWAYDALIHSALRTKNGKILPNEPITREDTAVYLYDCFGNGSDSLAPSIITAGTDNPAEIGWVYEHGIMTGNDGIDLRLNEGLTRAEAAVLIVNARQKLNTYQDFADSVPDEILKQVFDGSALFDKEYSRDAVLTNGEIAHAAYRLRLDRTDALWYDSEADFEHAYAGDLKAMETVLGTGRISPQFADSPAQPEDAFAMLAYGMASRIRIPVGYGDKDNFYKDAKLSSSALNAPLTFAYKNGIYPFANGILKTGSPVTHKTIAAVLLQYNDLWGIQTSLATDGAKITYKDQGIAYGTLPANAGLIQSVPAGVPSDVIALPFLSADGKEITPAIAPKENYPFCNDMKEAFGKELGGICADISKKYGVSVSLTYYPQLVYDNGGSIVVRAKVNTGGSPEKLFAGYRLYKDSMGESWAEIPLSQTFILE